MAETRYQFTNILKQGAAKGILPNKSREAVDWFRKRALEVNRTQPQRFFASMGRDHFPMLGNMYSFRYTAKHHNKLPYWDRWPLIFLADFPRDGNGFFRIKSSLSSFGIKS